MHIKSIPSQKVIGMHFKKALQRLFFGVLLFHLIVSDDFPLST
jgi:hypothetical protein